jgi:hypothetical protein
MGVSYRFVIAHNAPNWASVKLLAGVTWENISCEVSRMRLPGITIVRENEAPD